VPARHMGWMCRCGERLPEASLRCARCGRGYRREGEGLAEQRATEA